MACTKKIRMTTTDIMLAVVVILIFFVQAIQSLGDWAVRRLSHR
jgi:D-methionine transport system permease protein